VTQSPGLPPDAKPWLVVPAYFHPAVHPDQWQWLAEHAAWVRMVILNVANGPGAGSQAAFRQAVGWLQRAGICVIGYVDTSYGRREARRVLAETDRFQDWYGVQGVCLDQVAADRAQLGYYAGLTDQIRAMGAETVFFNHGTHPVPEYAGVADLLGTFEGTWSAYRRLRVPRWTAHWPPSKFYHVVHSVPAARLAGAWRLASRRRAGAAYITERDGPNPYDGLPALTQRPLTQDTAEAEPR
jgi:hypothetical protein